LELGIVVVAAVVEYMLDIVSYGFWKNQLF
jgi:hypothetical protein